MTKARDLANASTALSAVDATELGYLNNVTSAIQTQLDAKAASATAVSTAGGSTVTVASGTTVPLTIQNNGTGNSLVVNDDTSDTSPFTIGAGGAVTAGSTLNVYGGAIISTAGSTNNGINNGLQLVTVTKTGTPAGGQGNITITSDDSTNQLQGNISLVSSATAANRRLTIGAIEQNVAYRNVTLAEGGGNVGINTSTPAYQLDVNGTVNATALYVGGAALSTTPTFIGAGAYNSATYNAANSTLVTLTFNTEKYDTSSFHDNTTNTSRFTIPSGKAGYYECSLLFAFEANSTGFRRVEIHKNGTKVYQTDNSGNGGGSTDTKSISAVLNLAVGDYIEYKVTQNSGGNLTCYVTDQYCLASIKYLGV
jgi:hypothetical protein